MQTKTTKINATILIGITMLAMAITASQLVDFVAAKSRDSIPSLNILILTNQEDKTDSAPYVSLNLDEKLTDTISLYGKNDDNISKTIQNLYAANISSYDVVIIDCYLPRDVNDTKWLKNKILENDIGLLFFGGRYSEENLAEFGDILPAYFIMDRNAINRTYDGALFGGIGIKDGPLGDYFAQKFDETKPIEILTDQIQVAVSKEEEERNTIDEANEKAKLNVPKEGSIFSNNIAWQSCPLLRERVFTFAKKPNTSTLVEVPNTKEPLVVLGNVSEFTTLNTKSEVMFISTGVGILQKDPGVFTWDSVNTNLTNSSLYDIDYTEDYKTENVTMNEPFKLWPYFNYLMYATVYTLAYNVTDKSVIESYADWPWSPIPHTKEATLWMTFVASLWVFNFWLFFTLGRKKKAKDAKLTGSETPAPNTESSPDKDVTTKPDSEEKTKQE